MALGQSTPLARCRLSCHGASSSFAAIAFAIGVSPMTDQALVEQVRRFFETYANTFDSIYIDGAAQFVQLYHAPSVTVRGDGSVHCLQSRDEQQAFFQKVADGYYREGYRGGGPFTNLDVVAIGTRSALATMDWELCTRTRR